MGIEDELRKRDRLLAEKTRRIRELEELARWLYGCPVPPKAADKAAERMRELGLED